MIIKIAFTRTPGHPQSGGIDACGGKLRFTDAPAANKDRRNAPADVCPSAVQLGWGMARAERTADLVTTAIKPTDVAKRATVPLSPPGEMSLT